MHNYTYPIDKEEANATEDDCEDNKLKRLSKTFNSNDCRSPSAPQTAID